MFTDAYAEIHKCQDSRTMPVLKAGQNLHTVVDSPGHVDLVRLQARSTSRIN